MNKSEREEREYKSLFTDERYAKQAWKKLIGESLNSDAAVLPQFIDAKGGVSPQSEVYDTAYKNVKTRLELKGLSRNPSKAEVAIECNAIQIAFNPNVLNIFLDRTAGKVKEEVAIGVGAFEDLSDEELEVLAAHRLLKESQKALPGGADDNT